MCPLDAERKYRLYTRKTNQLLEEKMEIFEVYLDVEKKITTLTSGVQIFTKDFYNNSGMNALDEKQIEINEKDDIIHELENKCNEVFLLAKDDKEKVIKIESMSDEMKLMNEEIKSMKLEKAALERRVEELMGILDDKVGEMAVDKHDMVQHSDVATTIADIDERMMVNMCPSFSLREVKIENEVEMERETESGKNAVENCLSPKTKRPFVWKISGLAETRCGHMVSENFNGCTEAYQMLLVYFWGQDRNVYIWLRIDASDNKWPFERNVTMTISEPRSPCARKSIRKHCKIVNYLQHDSDAFIFNRTDLSEEGFMLDKGFIVECVIHDD